MGLLGLVIFVVAQVVILLAFSRVVIRLPAQINDLLFRRHLENDFTRTDSKVAQSIRDKLLELEVERLDAIVSYEAVKGKRLSVTGSAQLRGRRLRRLPIG